MDELGRQAFLATLVADLSARGWTGKTLVQKAVFFAQEAAHVDLGFRFVLHHYGPYSFELDAYLNSLAARDYIALEPSSDGYGVRVSAGRSSPAADVSAKAKDAVHVIAEELGGKNAKEAELLATVLFVQRRFFGLSEADVITVVRGLKPKFADAMIADCLPKVAGTVERLQVYDRS